MNRSITSHKRAKALAHASLAMGLWIAPVLSAVGAEYQRPCPPTYRCPPGYYDYYNQGALPQGAMPQAPRIGADGQPLPADASPSDLPPGEGQADAQAQTPQADPAADFNAAQASSSRASLAPGADTPQLGRMDAANRLNLFDNMTAAPQSKIWFGYQYASGINTGINPTPEFFDFLEDNLSFFPTPESLESFLDSQGQPSHGILARQRQSIYRVGAEVALYDDFSIAVQGQYFNNLTDSVYGDDWSNPQILLKYMLARDCDTILTATLGITPETSVDPGDLDENTTRLYPGMLFYETLSPDVFTQGGFQFGIPVREDQIHTFDWSLSLGFWLYQDPSLNSCCDCCCSGGLIQGIIPQVGLLGKHVIGDNTRAGAFGFQESSAFEFNGTFYELPDGFFIYNEPTDVVDLTVGTLFIVDRNVQVGVGYSLPITDNEVREDEFLTYVNYLF